MHRPRETTTESLLHQLATLAQSRTDRVLVGIVGPPGVGKSHTAEDVRSGLTARGVATEILPMDGYHLSNAQLEDLGLRDHKGAPETFDVHGLLALLKRIKTQRSTTIFFPEFDRNLDEAIAARGRIDPDTQVIVVEGNYLLLDHGPWLGIGDLLDLRWYLDADDADREQRLANRHMHFGRSLDDAWNWIESVDRPNADLVSRTSTKADVSTRVVTR